MTTRMQVLLEDDEFAEIRRVAKRHRMTVAEWVRQALRRARRDEPAVDPRKKLAAVRAAARGAYPTADIDQMLVEIEARVPGGSRQVIFVDSNIPMYLVGAPHPTQGRGTGTARGVHHPRRAPRHGRRGPAGDSAPLRGHQPSRCHPAGVRRDPRRGGSRLPDRAGRHRTRERAPARACHRSRLATRCTSPSCSATRSTAS